MSSEALSWVWEKSEATGASRTVLLRIAEQAGKHGENSWPGIATLAHCCRISERSVRICLNKLEEAGELLVFSNEGGSRGCPNDRRPNRYELPQVTGWNPPRGISPRKDSFQYMNGGNHSSSGDLPTGGTRVPLAGGTTVPEREEPQFRSGGNHGSSDIPKDLPKDKHTPDLDSTDARAPGVCEEVFKSKIWKPRAKRTGTDSYPTAWQEFQKLLEAGEPFIDIHAACIAYRKAMEAEGKIGTRYVKALSNFFAEDLWRDWVPTGEHPAEPARELQWFDSDDGIAAYAMDHYQIPNILFPLPVDKAEELIRQMTEAGEEIPEQLLARHKHLVEVST